MFCPWLVIRSMSRNACVTQMTAVRLTSTTRNAPNVVRKIYRPMDPIRGVVPQSIGVHQPGAWQPHRTTSLMSVNSTPVRVYLDPATKWPSKGKAVDYEQQIVKAGGNLGAKTGLERSILAGSNARQ